MTQRLKFGLVGYNVQYSRSPEIFQTIFEATNTVGEFEIYSLPPTDFHPRFEKLAAGGIDALSVTTPYKTEVARHMDRLGETAQAIAAINSIHIHGGKLTGYNTDVHGFASALHTFAARLSKAKALVLGSGGAARAVAYSLTRDFDIASVTVVGRSAGKLQEFDRAMAAHLRGATLITKTFSELVKGADPTEFELIVNCTPVGGGKMKGLSPLKDAFPWPSGKIYYDLNYGSEMPAIEQARAAGLSTIDGRIMLVAQAIKSFELWTGLTAAFEPVYDNVFGGK